MSAPVFERLLYTDCRAGGGRGGSNGFQIQAQSPGVDGAQARMAVGELTYSVQEIWISEGRPVEEFPLGFAHATDAGYGTAQSCYLGREVTGGRAGNHLADCLLTRDVEPYGAIRPAQLWRSEFWRHAPWDSTDCPPYDGFLEPGPLDNEALVGWLRDEPGRATALARLVSVLADPDGPRVVMIADEPDEALAWIAAATLLLPIRTAVTISFKVFISNLNLSQHRICALPRSLHPTLAAGGRHPRFHLDAGTGVTDEYEIAARAAYWVERLVGADDPYEVVDAVELADALGDGADARLAAWAVTAVEEPVADPAALARWLTAAGPADLQRYGTAVADRLLDLGPDPGSLRWIDAAAAAGHLGIDPVRVRATLVLAEIEEARGGSPARHRPLRPVDIGTDARRDAESRAGSAILLAPDDAAGDAAVDALLRVARRHAIALPLDSLRDRLQAFVARWLADPRADHRPDEWALEDPILDLLHQQLTHALARRGAAAVRPTARQVWPQLIDRSRDPNEPLNWQFHAAAVEAAAPRRRFDAIGAAFERLRRSRYLPSSMDGLQQAMLDWRVIGGREALLVSTLVPPELPLHPDIETAAVQAAEQGARQPDDLLLTAVNTLDRRGLLLPEELLRLHESDIRMRQITAIARSATVEADAERLVDALELARTVDGGVAATWATPLVCAALESQLSWLGAVLLGHIDGQLALRLLDRWSVELGTEQGARAAAYGVSWYADRDLPGALRTHLARLVAEHLETLAAEPRQEFVDRVRNRYLTADLATVWATLSDVDGGRSRRFGFSREKNR